eukprot:16428527-Heterocapsa_arctica.AAC.1
MSTGPRAHEPHDPQLGTARVTAPVRRDHLPAGRRNVFRDAGPSTGWARTFRADPGQAAS